MKTCTLYSTVQCLVLRINYRNDENSKIREIDSQEDSYYGSAVVETGSAGAVLQRPVYNGYYKSVETKVVDRWCTDL